MTKGCLEEQPRGYQSTEKSNFWRDQDRPAERSGQTANQHAERSSQQTSTSTLRDIRTDQPTLLASLVLASSSSPPPPACKTNKKKQNPRAPMLFSSCRRKLANVVCSHHLVSMPSSSTMRSSSCCCSRSPHNLLEAGMASIDEPTQHRLHIHKSQIKRGDLKLARTWQFPLLFCMCFAFRHSSRKIRTFTLCIR